jgi:hypothetical protein
MLLFLRWRNFRICGAYCQLFMLTCRLNRVLVVLLTFAVFSLLPSSGAMVESGEQFEMKHDNRFPPHHHRVKRGIGGSLPINPWMRDLRSVLAEVQKSQEKTTKRKGEKSHDKFKKNNNYSLNWCMVQLLNFNFLTFRLVVNFYIFFICNKVFVA